MRQLWGIGITLALCGLAAGGLWLWAQPGPPIPGDERWCRAIFNKPTETWTLDEARGYAEQNCMRWQFEKPEQETTQ